MWKKVLEVQLENVNKSLSRIGKIPIRKWKKNGFKNWKESPITN